jgi:transposase-like protein
MRTSILGKVHFMANKYDPETRAKAVRLVLEHRDDYPSEWAAITAVSKRLGMNAETLRNWIRQHQVDEGDCDGVSSAAAAEIRALKRRNAELEQTNDGPPQFSILPLQPFKLSGLLGRRPRPQADIDLPLANPTCAPSPRNRRRAGEQLR